MSGKASPIDGVVFHTIAWTWAFYAIGALYLVGPMLGWALGGLAVLSLYLGPAIRADLRATGAPPPVVGSWIAGMAIMLIALWAGHINWDMGLGQTIKSTIGWAKGWALMALFPLAGAVLPVGRERLIRAHCVLALVTLLLCPLLVAAPYAGAPGQLFTSPLKAVGGPGPEYFSVYLYTLDPASWTPRWQFYLPWSPFAGMMGVVLALFAREEPDWRWRWIGITAALAMILLSKSRMSLVALPVCLFLPALTPLVLRTWAWAAGAALLASMAVWGGWASRVLQDAITGFKQARADSTRVRETLQRIAEDRWASDAQWFGHGTVERGPHLVEYMMIGSHHTWFGLLFVKGAVGFAALALPMAWQFILAFADAAKGRRGRLPMGLMLALLILSMGENIEIEVYMLWPALLLLGIHAREIAGAKN